MKIKRLKQKRTWVKIYTKSGKEFLGQIDKLSQTEITLGYSQKFYGKEYNLKTILKISQIEAIGCLDCENRNVWTAGK